MILATRLREDDVKGLGIWIVAIYEISLQRLFRVERELGVGELGETQRTSPFFLHQPRGVKPVEWAENMANLSHRRVLRHPLDV